MKVSRIRALRGPNLWSRKTAIEVMVSCNDAEYLTSEIPDFAIRLRTRFPDLDPFHAAGQYGRVTMAHALERVTLGLQIQAGCLVEFSKTTQTLEPGTYQVVVEYSEEAVGRLALEFAQALCHAAAVDTPFDLADAVKQLRELNEEIRLGPSTRAIVNAAVVRGIPFRRLTDGSMVQFGWGSKQRRIQAAETSFTGAIAESIAQDKELTRSLLERCGYPRRYRQTGGKCGGRVGGRLRDRRDGSCEAA